MVFYNGTAKCMLNCRKHTASYGTASQHLEIYCLNICWLSFSSFYQETRGFCCMQYMMGKSFYTVCQTWVLLAIQDARYIRMNFVFCFYIVVHFILNLKK